MKLHGNVKCLLPSVHMHCWPKALRALATRLRGAWLKAERGEMQTRHQSQAKGNIWRPIWKNLCECLTLEARQELETSPWLLYLQWEGSRCHSERQPRMMEIDDQFPQIIKSGLWRLIWDFTEAQGCEVGSCLPAEESQLPARHTWSPASRQLCC